MCIRDSINAEYGGVRNAEMDRRRRCVAPPSHNPILWGTALDPGAGRVAPSGLHRSTAAPAAADDPQSYPAHAAGSVTRRSDSSWHDPAPTTGAVFETAGANAMPRRGAAVGQEAPWEGHTVCVSKQDALQERHLQRRHCRAATGAGEEEQGGASRLRHLKEQPSQIGALIQHSQP
eukprot:TRINITY_DN2566_c0_g1_i1.p1 TRINITY_DN2566_c0_g1~~TRINITY_DN2566_c0_g1_i1.p1  ORF type:complete len:176 (-),score=23.79 TRINITY_DN2566_c0_g1_i1:334-861(-)